MEDPTFSGKSELYNVDIPPPIEWPERVIEVWGGVVVVVVVESLSILIKLALTLPYYNPLPFRVMITRGRRRWFGERESMK